MMSPSGTLNPSLIVAGTCRDFYDKENAFYLSASGCYAFWNLEGPNQIPPRFLLLHGVAYIAKRPCYL